MNINSKLNVTSLNGETKNVSQSSNNIQDKKYIKKDDKVKDFKRVLNERANNKNNDIRENSKLDDEESDSKDKDIKEKIENSSKDELIEIINSIFNMLSSVNNNDADSKSINSNVIELIMNNTDKQTSSKDLSKLLDNLMDASKNSLKDILSSDNKDLLKSLLNKLGDKLDEGTELSNKIKDLMNQVCNSLENKENKENKDLSFNSTFKNFDQNANSQTSKENINEEKVVNNSSGEDDFLNKLLKGKKEDNILNKINLVASRNEVNLNNVQNAGQSTVINKTTMGEDLIKNIKFMMNNAMKELTVKINPKDLGQLTISLIQENGIMKANIKANSKETFELLSQNLIQMKKAITEQNIKIADVNVELYQEDTTFYKDESFQRGLDRDNEKQNKNNNRQTSEIESIQLDDEVTEDLNSNLDFFA